ncbi:MAG: TetR/AcrR family transcriptional regulator, partial [Marinobacter vinifirmus]
MATTKAPEKRTYQSTELRQSATIEAVIQLCAEQDPATLTTARIADEVGLSQGALFKHFPNKNRLWESVAGWVSEQLTSQVFREADRHEHADQALEAMFRAHVGFIARHPGIPRLMLGELQKPGNGPAKTIIRQTLARYRKKV